MSAVYPFSPREIAAAILGAEDSPFFFGHPSQEMGGGNPNHDKVGRFASKGEKAAPKLSRSEKASKSHKASTAEKQRWAEANEVIVQKGIGKAVRRTSDSATMDLMFEGAAGGGRALHGVEVKTLLDNGNSKITMHPSSRRRKELWAEGRDAIVVREGGRIVAVKPGKRTDVAWKGSPKTGEPAVVSKLPRVAHTIVLDDRNSFGNGPQWSGHRVYYRRGVGAFDLHTMTPVKSFAHLRKLISAK